MNTMEDNCYVILSLSFFLRFQSMFQRYEDRNDRRRNAWRNEEGGERENDKVSRITSSCKNVDMYPACGR